MYVAMATVTPYKDYPIFFLKSRYPLCCACFIKRCVNFCILNSPYTVIDVNFNKHIYVYSSKDVLHQLIFFFHFKIMFSINLFFFFFFFFVFSNKLLKLNTILKGLTLRISKQLFVLKRLSKMCKNACF